MVAPFYNINHFFYDIIYNNLKLFKRKCPADFVLGYIMRKINIVPNIFNYQTQKTTSVGNDTLYLLQEGCFTFLLEK